MAKNTDHEKRLKAAMRLLLMEEISFHTFEDLRALLTGVNKTIDDSLAKASDTIKTLKAVHKGDTLTLSEKAAKKLPEDSDKRKKRKRALLLFITSWKNLRNEVRRAIKTLESGDGMQSDGSSAVAAKKAGSLISRAKGPLGVTTLVATGIAAAVITLNNIGREVVIQNNGCEPLEPQVSLPVPIPGLSLPDHTIRDGEQATAVIPPLSFTVDGTSGNTITLKALNFTLGFSLGNGGTDVVFNGTSLVGKTTTVNLAERDSHTVTISCSPTQRIAPVR